MLCAQNMKIKFLCIVCLLVFPLSLVAEDKDKRESLDKAQELLIEGKSKEALALMLPFAEAGDIEAQIMLGNYYQTNEKNIKKAREWLRKASVSGDSYAQLHFGLSYIGKGDPKQDAEGIEWLSKSANQNNKDAAETLSTGYKNGWWGLPKDLEKAKLWSKKASVDN